MNVQAACHYVVIMLCNALQMQARYAALCQATGSSESAGAASGAASTGRTAAAPPADSHQPPVAAVCSLLQQFVRQDAAAARVEVDARDPALRRLLRLRVTSFHRVVTGICDVLVTTRMMGLTFPGALVESAVAAGQLDSPDALQLLDLLYSLLKAINSTSQLDTASFGWEWAEVVAGTAAVFFVKMLSPALSDGRAAADSNSSAAVVLPWLVLLGRCAAAAAAAAATVAAQAGAASPPSLDSPNCTALSNLAACLENVEGWLQAGPAAAELSGMGYEPETVLAQLSAMVAPTELLALKQSCSAESGVGSESEAGADGVLSASWLQAAGSTLTSFAVPHCCNNPACVNTAGPSEAQLVNGRGNLCGGCRVARYCSRSCLRQHWGQHKPVCKALAAAAVAQAGSAAQVPSG